MVNTPRDIRTALLVISAVLFLFGIVHRIRSQRSGESLDRTQEGWPILIGIRLIGLTIWCCVACWFWNPALLDWASIEMAPWIRWISVGVFAASALWLAWMFRSSP